MKLGSATQPTLHVLYVFLHAMWSFTAATIDMQQKQHQIFALLCRWMLAMNNGVLSGIDDLFVDLGRDGCNL